MLAPKVKIPPSAKKMAWIKSTIDMLMTAAWGPSNTARKVPPTRCPEVPYTIGKFSIWATKTKALETAMMGTSERENVLLAPLQAHVKKTNDTTYIRTQRYGSRKPSGICIPFNLEPETFLVTLF